MYSLIMFFESPFQVGRVAYIELLFLIGQDISVEHNRTKILLRDP